MPSFQQFPNLPAKIVDDDGRLTESYRYFFRALWERTGGATGAVSIQLDALGNTPGDILFRDASEWRARDIGPAGALLTPVNGFPQWRTLSAILDQLGNSTGALIMRGAAAWQLITPGSTNQLLKSNGPGQLLSWSNALLALALLMPDIFVVTSSNNGGIQTITVTLADQPANTIFAGPIAGVDAAPTFRVFAPQDLTQLPTRVVIAAGAVTVTNDDYIVALNKTAGAATVVNLMATPATGTQIIVKDAKGDANANNITITPAAGNIDGAGTYVINTNYGSAWISYNGAEWSMLGSR